MKGWTDRRSQLLFPPEFKFYRNSVKNSDTVSKIPIGKVDGRSWCFSTFPVGILQMASKFFKIFNSDGNSNRIQVVKSSWLYLIFLIMSGLISHIQLLFLIFSLLGETRDNFFRFWLELITSFRTLGSAKQFVQSKYSRLELLIVPEQMIYYWFVTNLVCLFKSKYYKVYIMRPGRSRLLGFEKKIVLVV